MSNQPPKEGEGEGEGEGFARVRAGFLGAAGFVGAFALNRESMEKPLKPPEAGLEGCDRAGEGDGEGEGFARVRAGFLGAAGLVGAFALNRESMEKPLKPPEAGLEGGDRAGVEGRSGVLDLGTTTSAERKSSMRALAAAPFVVISSRFFSIALNKVLKGDSCGGIAVGDCCSEGMEVGCRLEGSSDCCSASLTSAGVPSPRAMRLRHSISDSMRGASERTARA